MGKVFTASWLYSLQMAVIYCISIFRTIFIFNFEAREELKVSLKVNCRNSYIYILNIRSTTYIMSCLGYKYPFAFMFQGSTRFKYVFSAIPCTVLCERYKNELQRIWVVILRQLAIEYPKFARKHLLCSPQHPWTIFL